MIQGGSPKTLQKVLGHRSATFSLTVYGHLFDAELALHWPIDWTP
jgi:integrase